MNREFRIEYDPNYLCRYWVYTRPPLQGRARYGEGWTLAESPACAFTFWGARFMVWRQRRKLAKAPKVARIIWSDQ